MKTNGNIIRPIGRTPPEGLPSWITDEVICDTLATWQPFYAHRLTVEDVVDILLTAGNLLAVLKGEVREEVQRQAERQRLEAA